jgi:periplasmic copper chaperone A
MSRLSAIVALMAAFFVAAASPAAEAPIAVSGAWAKPTLKGTTTGAAYLMLTNRGSASDRLIALSTPVAERAELHQDVVKNGVMSMQPVPSLTLAPGATAAIAPGKYHVMLIGVKQPLKSGDSFPLTLTFEQAGAVQVMVAVRAAAPTAPMPKMDHM